MAQILIIEDDARAAKAISDGLRTAGHTCLVKGTGDNALELARETGVDLVILDVMLPGACGFEICRWFRADSELHTLPILMLSAMVSEEEVMHGLAQGADDYICKPFDMRDLIGRVDRLVQSNAEATVPDTATSLPGASAIKREVQMRITRHDVFALVCAELTNLRPFTYLFGSEARERAIRHLARALELCGQDLPQGDFVAGHMGGGYFATVMDSDAVQAYCSRVKKTWDSHLPNLYEGIGQREAFDKTLAGKASGKPIPLLNLLVCVTVKDLTTNISAQEMFDIISHLRKNALEKGIAGVHYDRRGCPA